MTLAVIAAGPTSSPTPPDTFFVRSVQYAERPPFNSISANMATASANLMFRLDPDSKDCIARAAELRRVRISDYVRSAFVAQARREIDVRRHPHASRTTW
jgi:hypothetical protein